MNRVRRAWSTLLLLAALCVLPVAAVTVSQSLDAGSDAVSGCWSRTLPDGVEPHDDTLRTVEITAVPAGVHCDWEAGDAQTGWPVTIAALIGTAIAVILTALALVRGGWLRRVLSVLPLLGIAVLWLAMYANTSFIIID